jgi:hypothetical protein
VHLGARAAQAVQLEVTLVSGLAGLGCHEIELQIRQGCLCHRVQWWKEAPALPRLVMASHRLTGQTAWAIGHFASYRLSSTAVLVICVVIICKALSTWVDQSRGAYDFACAPAR